MATIRELKEWVDLHDLAEKLGLERPQSSGNYRSPHHDDKSPSLSIYDGGKRWKDHSGDAGGDCIDLVAYVRGCDKGEAIRELHELYGFPLDRRPKAERPRGGRKSRAQYIAEKCFQEPERAIQYLVEERAIAEDVAGDAVKSRAVGFNAWESDKVAAGEPGHGGPAVAFIVQSINPGEVLAVDLRYLDPELNGGVKTQTQGEKSGCAWSSSWRRVAAADTVYLVESPINALSVESAGLRKTAAVAIRGVANADTLELEFLRGKRVVLCFDDDEPDKYGRRAGPEAAWTLHERLTATNIAAHMVDQLDWPDHGWNDVNDILQGAGADELQKRLFKIEQWIIAGLPGKKDGEPRGRKRLHLPYHDELQYKRYTAREDFTSLVSMGEDDEGKPKPKYDDVCGFRIAGLSRVTIASYTSTMTGERDAQPRTLFAAAVQVPRHGPTLIRRVYDDEDLHNVDRWRKFGPVFKPAAFSRLLTILERAAHLGERNATNFVGLAWRDGRPVVNEGPDCYFTDPAKQCPYHNLTFPRGTRDDACRVIDAYQETFQRNAALILLVWALGAHLKAFLGFWPHMTLQADKGAGKSTLIKRLERSIAFTMFSGESLQTAFRLLTSISHTSQPVGWEEISARQQIIIDQAVTKLQESYQYTVSRRSSDMTEYLLSAPVLLAGEDVPVRSLLGKVVRTELTGRKGPLLDERLPRFPVRNWLEFLTSLSRDDVEQRYAEIRTTCEGLSRASGSDEGARRMAGNYAALATAWRYLCEFAGRDHKAGGFGEDLIATMNHHIGETSADREPWVWILETTLSEIESGRFKHPHQWGKVDDGHGNAHECLIFRSSHAVDHLAREPGLRDKWNMLPVKSDRVFKRQLLQAGVVVQAEVERTFGGHRYAHLVAVGLAELERYGLYAAPPELKVPDE